MRDPVTGERPLTMSMRSALLKISRYEEDAFGVIVDARIGPALIERGYCTEGGRRWYARRDGTCCKLTDKGRAWVAA